MNKYNLIDENPQSTVVAKYSPTTTALPNIKAKQLSIKPLLNNPITELIDFIKTFFEKQTILNILTRYCVLNSDRLLLVKRPYQIVATEQILNCIETSTSMKQLDTRTADGYI